MSTPSNLMPERPKSIQKQTYAGNKNGLQQEKNANTKA
jgi:hypothetical protein